MEVELGGEAGLQVDDQIREERKTSDLCDWEEPQKGKPRLVGPEGGYQKECPRRLEQFVDDPGDEGNRGKQVSQVEVPRATEGVELFRGRR